MNTSSLCVQLYFGPSEAAALSLGEVVSAVEATHRVASFGRLLFWNAVGDEALWQALSGLSERLSFELWLWYPVFADTGTEPTPAEEVLGPDGAGIHGSAGAWDGLFAGGSETFRFACPNALPQRNLTALAALLPQISASLTGVFLDRIRFPAPSNGSGSLLACACPACQARWLEEGSGEDLPTVLRSAASRLKSLEDGQSRDYPDAIALLDGVGLHRVRAFRAAAVTRTAEAYRIFLMGKGLALGLDLFSPSLAPLVGQDYAALSYRCDWIKSMSYCHARGPAGLPLELECLDRGLAALAPLLSAGERRRLCYGLLGGERPEDRQTYDLTPAYTLPPTVAASEAERGQALSSPVPVYAGVELVNHPLFSTKISADQAADYASVLGARSPGSRPGVAASWNLLYIPPENLAPFAEERRHP